MSSHNKKRNIGLVYELLLRSISSSLVEGDKEKAHRAMDIIKNRFSKKTEIYSEYRIFDAIMSTTVNETAVAAGILTEAKGAIRRVNNKRLFAEKSKLISEINKTLGDKDFFNRRIPNYREFATVGMVVEQWRQKDKSDLSKQVINEQRLIEFMMSDKTSPELLEEMTDDRADKLVVKIMTEKINNMYEDLMPEQKTILSQYALYSTDLENEKLTSFLKEVKSQSLSELHNLKESTDNAVLLSKVDVVIDKVNSLKENNLNDNVISRYLKVIELKKQLRIM